MCLSMPPDPIPRWFILRNKRAQAIPSCPSQPPEGSAVVALDWGIYVIGGLVNGKRTTGVLCLDFRSHKWHHVTSMTVARESAQASVVDGKIYVVGGCDGENPSHWGEVFDPKMQTWEAVPMWEDKFANKKSDWLCVVDNLLYTCWSDGIIYWYDDKIMMRWDMVVGLPVQKLQEYFRFSKLVHYGGETAREWDSFRGLGKNLPGAKMISFGQTTLIFWDQLVGRGRKSLEIWCDELTFNRYDYNRYDYDRYGNVKWSNAILTLDPLQPRSKLLYTISS